MRIEAAVGVDARIEQQTEVVPVSENAVHKLISELAELLLALGIPEQVLAFLADGDIGVHAAAVDAHNRLRQEGGSQAHIPGHLAADQLVELDMVGGGHHFGVAVVNLELRGRDLRMVLLVLEAHGPLHFGGRIDKRAQRIARQRVVITARIDVFELARLVVLAFGLGSLEQEALDLVGGVERVAVLLVQSVGKQLQHAANVGGVGLSAFVDDLAKDENLAGSENIGRTPVECAPVNA